MATGEKRASPVRRTDSQQAYDAMKRSGATPGQSMSGTGVGAGDQSRSFAIGLNQVDEDDRLVEDGRSPGQEFLDRLGHVSGDKRARTREEFNS